MKVEIFVEVQAVRPLPADGETYDTEAPSTWKVQDSITSDDKEIISSFLLGVADEIDPTGRSHGTNKPAIVMHTNWKIVVHSNSDRGNPPGVIAELVTKKNGVAGSMLRGTARSINPDTTIMKQPTMRDSRD